MAMTSSICRKKPRTAVGGAHLVTWCIEQHINTVSTGKQDRDYLCSHWQYQQQVSTFRFPLSLLHLSSILRRRIYPLRKSWGLTDSGSELHKLRREVLMILLYYYYSPSHLLSWIYKIPLSRSVNIWRAANIFGKWGFFLLVTFLSSFPPLF